jgi:hypothetical protein
VVAICLGCSTEEARAALKKANAKDILVLLDAYTEAVVPYRASATPTTYLIDYEGVIQLGSIGYGSGTEARLRDEIEQLLEE